MSDSKAGMSGLRAEAGPFLRRYPGQLSVGQAQRVIVAMAVLHRPKLILADEPTSALDPASRKECLDLFRQINREFGSAILFISHDLPSMTELCARIAVLRDGKLVECREVKPARATAS